MPDMGIRSVIKLMSINGQPIEIIRTGEYHHEIYGIFTVTVEMLEEAVENFPGSDLIPVDFSHSSLDPNPENAIAAGWLQRIFIGPSATEGETALMGEVHWTDRAKEYIANDEYRFISAEIAFNDIDTGTGEAIGCNLLACALTNRPFVVGMSPVSLSVPMDSASKIELFVRKMAVPESLMDQVREVISAFYQLYPDTQSVFWYIEDVRKDNLIVSRESADGRKLFQVNYSRADNSVEFQAQAEWVEVQQTYVPLVQTTISNTLVSYEARVKEGKKEMDENQIRELLGLEEGADIQEAIASLVAKVSENDQQIAELTDSVSTLTAKNEELVSQTTEPEEVELQAKNAEITRLTRRAEAVETENVRLAERVARLEKEQNDREANERLNKALSEGRMEASEIDGDDSIMRVLAFEQPEVFDRIVANRPVQKVTVELGIERPDPEPTNGDERFWSLVNETMDADKSLSQSLARAKVIEGHPEFSKLNEEV